MHRLPSRHGWIGMLFACIVRNCRLFVSRVGCYTWNHVDNENQLPSHANRSFNYRSSPMRRIAERSRVDEIHAQKDGMLGVHACACRAWCEAIRLHRPDSQTHTQILDANSRPVVAKHFVGPSSSSSSSSRIILDLIGYSVAP